MRRMLPSLMVFVLVLTLTGIAWASPRVVVDNQELPVSAVVEGGRTLVPLRAIFEALGAEVNYDGATGVIVATRGDTQVKLTLGQSSAAKNGQAVTLDVPAKAISGRTLVPLRFVSEALGAEVRWDAQANAVYISSLPSSEKVIKIGFIGPLSGDVSSFGEAVKQGFDLALEEANYQAGEFRIEAVVADDCANATTAVNVATKMINRDGVAAIVGSVTSNCSVPISEVAQEAGVVMISPTATSPWVTVDVTRKDYIFRAPFIDAYQGAVGAKFALDTLKTRTAAVLYDKDNPYSVSLSDGFIGTFTKNGGEVVVCESHSPGDRDFRKTLQQIAGSNAGVVFLADYYTMANVIANQARELGIDTVFLGGDGWDSIYLDFEVLNGHYFVAHYSGDDPRPEVREWLDKFNERYGTYPDSFSTLGYDATKMLLKAIADARSADPARIRDAMQNLKDFPAVTGKTSFDPLGNPLKPAVVLQVQRDGTYKYVDTVMP
ncbi:MAG: ABC transporter substrate-binding protein [Thermoanaerobacterales bacterium]|nr:ABC transporter substrate-binding protein [Thermoanaerobacterales bacterium]